MTIDFIGGVALVALFALVVAMLGVSASPRQRRWGFVGAFIWLTVIGAVAAAGVFADGTLGPLALGAAIITPLLWSTGFFARSSPFQRVALATPLALLIGVHAGRLLGIFFLRLLADERLSPTFALTAGWGDVGVALAALPVAWIVHRRAPGWPIYALVWNIAGALDLVAAIVLGIGSAPDSPLRFIHESPGSATVTVLPWSLIPSLLVPLYLMTHLLVFVRLAPLFALDRRQEVKHAA